MTLKGFQFGAAACPSNHCCCAIGKDSFTLNDGSPHDGWTYRPLVRSSPASAEATNSGNIYSFSQPAMEKFNAANPEGAESPTHVGGELRLSESASLTITTLRNGGTVNEYQRVYYDGPSGNFALDFGGYQTGFFSGNGIDGAVQAALEALPSIGTGNVIVGYEWDLPVSSQLFVIFRGALAGTDVAQMTLVPGSTGTSVSTLHNGGAGDPEQQRVRVAGASGGTFTLTFDGQTTGNIAYNASAATVQAALEALSNIAPGDVTVVLNATSDWTVEFAGAYAGVNVPEMSGDKSGLTNTGGTGSSADIFIGYLSDYVFLFARVHYHADDEDCDHLELYKRQGGTDEILTLPDPDNSPARVPIRNLALNTWYRFDVCLKPDAYTYPYGYDNGDVLRAKIVVAGKEFALQANVPGFDGGTYAGLGSGLGSVDFRKFTYDYFRSSSHGSCPNCNGGCEIFTEDFSVYDAASDNVLGCFWDATEGVARFDGTYMQADAGSRIKCLIPHPTNKNSKVITETFLWEASKKVRIDSGSGYAIFDSTTGAKRITLYDNDGTLLSQSDIDSLPASDDTLHSATVSYVGGVLSATMDGVCVQVDSPDTGDPYVYLGSNGGTVKFATFAFEKGLDSTEPKDRCDDGPSCPPEPCSLCDPDDPPGALIIDLSAYALTDRYCDGTDTTNRCEDITGEFVLIPYQITPTAACGNLDPCSRVYVIERFSTHCCNPTAQFTCLELNAVIVAGADPARLRWKFITTFGLACQNPFETFACEDELGDPVTASTPTSAVYYSEDFDADECTVFPRTMTKSSDNISCPCGGTFPATLILDSAA